MKGSYAGDVGWNAGAGEHLFFNRRHGAPDRYQALPPGYDANALNNSSNNLGGGPIGGRGCLLKTF